MPWAAAGALKHARGGATTTLVTSRAAAVAELKQRVGCSTVHDDRLRPGDCARLLAKEMELRAVALTAAALSVYRVAFHEAVPGLTALCNALSLRIAIPAVAAVRSAAVGAPGYSPACLHRMLRIGAVFIVLTHACGDDSGMTGMRSPVHPRYQYTRLVNTDCTQHPIACTSTMGPVLTRERDEENVPHRM